MKVITKDFGYATTPDSQTNIQTFCILNILGDESLREEHECRGSDKAMLVDPIIAVNVKEPLKPLNGWLPYDEELRDRIKGIHPDASVTEDLIEAIYRILDLVTLGDVRKAAELGLEAWGGFDFDEICNAFAKWQRGYTVGNAPSEDFFDENDHDCWTYVFGFNINENLCTGANGIWLNYPFSFDTEGNHEIKIHVDAMFEGDVPSLGIKGGRIGKEYQLELDVSDQA